MPQKLMKRTPLIGIISTELLLGFTLVVSASPAFASPTWMPKFKHNQHLYVDPHLSQDPTYPVRFFGLEQKLEQAASKHHMEVYLVAALQGEETPLQKTDLAADKLDDLIARWQQSQPGFPAENELTILWIRCRDNPNKGWVAANAGDRLRAAGLTRDKFNESDGPVNSALRAYMPNNPQAALIAIVNNVNHEIDLHDLLTQMEVQSAMKEQQKLKESAAWRRNQSALLVKAAHDWEQRAANFLQKAFIYAVWGGTCIILLVIAYRLSIRFLTKRKAALSLLTHWQERLNNANALYIKLSDNYLEFLISTSDWTTKFHGTTRTQYQSAVADFAEFSIRLQAAIQLLTTAKKASSKNIYPLTTGFAKAISLLMDEPIVVTGEALPLEKAKLFTGLIFKRDLSARKFVDSNVRTV